MEAYQKVKQLLTIEGRESPGLVGLRLPAGKVSQADGHGTKQQSKTPAVTDYGPVEGSKNAGTIGLDVVSHIVRHSDICWSQVVEISVL